MRKHKLDPLLTTAVVSFAALVTPAVLVTELVVQGLTGLLITVTASAAARPQMARPTTQP